MKKYILIFPVIAIALFSFTKTYASSIFIEHTQGISSGCTQIANQYHCSGTASSTGAVSQWISNVDSSGDNSGCADNAWIYDSNDITKLATSTAISGGRITFTFPTSTFIAGHTYWYRQDFLSVCGIAGGVVNHAYDSTTGFYGDSIASTSLISGQILYPENRTDIFIHDFTDFTFVATNTDSFAHNVQFQIIYDTTSTFTNTPLVVLPQAGTYAFASGATHYLTATKGTNLATSTTFYAKLCVNADNTTWSCNTPVSFKTGVYPVGFKINTNGAGINGATTTESGIMYPAPTSTTNISDSSSLCDVEFYDPASWACWGWYKFTYGIDWITGKVKTLFSDAITNLEATFPANVVIAFNNDIQSVQATTTAYAIDLQGRGTAFKKKGGGYYDFPILTSSTLPKADKTGLDWESLVSYLLYAGTGIIILGVSFAVLHKKSNESNPHA